VAAKSISSTAFLEFQVPTAVVRPADKCSWSIDKKAQKATSVTQQTANLS